MIWFINPIIVPGQLNLCVCRQGRDSDDNQTHFLILAPESQCAHDARSWTNKQTNKPSSQPATTTKALMRYLVEAYRLVFSMSII